MAVSGRFPGAAGNRIVLRLRSTIYGGSSGREKGFVPAWLGSGPGFRPEPCKMGMRRPMAPVLRHRTAALRRGHPVTHPAPAHAEGAGRTERPLWTPSSSLGPKGRSLIMFTRRPQPVTAAPLARGGGGRGAHADRLYRRRSRRARACSTRPSAWSAPTKSFTAAIARCPADVLDRTFSETGGV